MEFQICSEEQKDIEQVRAVIRSAFPAEAESKLVDALHQNGKVLISLVAVNPTSVLGHILFSPVTTSPPSDDGLAFEKQVALVWEMNMGWMTSPW